MKRTTITDARRSNKKRTLQRGTLREREVLYKAPPSPFGDGLRIERNRVYFTFPDGREVEIYYDDQWEALRVSGIPGEGPLACRLAIEPYITNVMYLLFAEPPRIPRKEAKNDNT